MKPYSVNLSNVFKKSNLSELSQIITPSSFNEGYGAYAFGFSIYLFFVSFPSGLIWEPMAVLGVVKDKKDHANYFIQLLFYQFLLSLLVVIPLAISSFIFTEEGGASLLSVSLALPFMLLIWFSRQMCYFRTSPGSSLKISVLYFLFQIIIIFALYLSNRLSIINVFASTAISSTASFLIGWWIIGLVKDVNLKKLSLIDKQLISTHWQYGKWILMAGLAHGIANTILIPLLGIFSNLTDVAVFKAMQNFIQPVQQSLIAISLVMLPIASRKVNQTSNGIPRKTILYLVISTFFISLLYWIFLVIWGKEIITVVYRKNYYQYYSWLLSLMGLSVVIFSVGQVYRILLRAIKQPDAIFWSKAFPALFVITIGIALIWKYEMLGAGITMISSVLIETIVLTYRFYRKPIS